MVGAFNHYLSDMERLGYTNSFEVLDARNFGIPQFRERIFTVSLIGDQRFNFADLERKSMRPITDYLETGITGEQYQVRQPSMIAKLPENCPPGTTRKLSYIEDYAYTITTKQMRCPNSGIVIDDEIKRYLTERECWRLMGFSDEDFELALAEHPSKEGCLNGTLYHQAGNSIVVDVLEAIFKQLVGEYIEMERQS